MQTSFTHPLCCCIPAIVKTLSLPENRNFAPASGTINARHFFQIQAELDPTRKAQARPTTLRSVASEDGDLLTEKDFTIGRLGTLYDGE